MRSPFDAVDAAVVGDLVGARWAAGARVTLSEVLEGGGADHWVAASADGRRWFVTCDDLRTKPWLGDDEDTVFEHLLAAYGSAIDLGASGLPSVVAPIPSRSGQPAERLDARHSVAVFEHVAGIAGRWGEPLAPDDADELVVVLAGVHRHEPVASRLAHRGLDVPGRGAFERRPGLLRRAMARRPVVRRGPAASCGGTSTSSPTGSPRCRSPRRAAPRHATRWSSRTVNRTRAT